MRATLFDLDGTLLDIDLPAFLERYFAALSEVIGGLIGQDAVAPGMDALLRATRTMSEPHDGRTNRDVFGEEFLALCGIDLDRDAALFDAFYEDVFPALGAGIGPVPGAREAVDAAIASGMRVAVATNPIFPLRAIEHRIAWAGLDDVPFDLVTSFENMTATKPHAAYYRQIAGLLGVDTRECLMVGDDPVLDLAAADVGMLTYYVGDGVTSADFHGDLARLAKLIPRLAVAG